MRTKSITVVTSCAVGRAIETGPYRNQSEPFSVREFAATLVSLRRMGICERRMVIDLLRLAMERQPILLGLWCVFEPMAFDGNDTRFTGQDGHDAAGRFAPRWDRNQGCLRFGSSCGHDSPSLGGWYFLARDSRQEVVFGPYDEAPLTSLSVLCLSRVAPILERDEFIGAVGLDVSLDSLLPRGGNDAPPNVEAAEALFERWHVVLGEGDKIEFASARARRLLATYTGAPRGGRLAALLSERLDAHDSGPVHFIGSDGELNISLLRHPHTGQRILSLEETQRSHRVRLSGNSLSRREEEVLDWIEQGKSNGEIGLILGISEHTVRHHVERIFAKLGVENRHAAMLCAGRVRLGEGRFISRVPGFS